MGMHKYELKSNPWIAERIPTRIADILIDPGIGHLCGGWWRWADAKNRHPGIILANALRLNRH